MLSDVHFQQAACLEQHRQNAQKDVKSVTFRAECDCWVCPISVIYFTELEKVIMSLMAPMGKKLLIRHFDLPPFAQEM